MERARLRAASICDIDDGSRVFSSSRLVMGVAWAQAGRDHMQDSFALSLSCRDHASDIDFFGVFDGHGINGENVSRHVAYRISDLVLKVYAEREDMTFPQAIEAGFLLLDAQIRRDPDMRTVDGVVWGGSTACAVWMTDEYIYSGNVGDSRFILSYNGRAYPVTKDHKPDNRGEHSRIEAAGAFVRSQRVNGMLGVARAFGDFRFKVRGDLGPHEQSVTALPDVRTVELEDEIDFLVVASDGVWDSKTNQEVVDFIIERMKLVVPLNEIGEQLIESCRLPVNPETGLGSDNMTIMIAVLR